MAVGDPRHRRRPPRRSRSLAAGVYSLAGNWLPCGALRSNPASDCPLDQLRGVLLFAGFPGTRPSAWRVPAIIAAWSGGRHVTCDAPANAGSAGVLRRASGQCTRGCRSPANCGALCGTHRSRAAGTGVEEERGAGGGGRPQSSAFRGAGSASAEHAPTTIGQECYSSCECLAFASQPGESGSRRRIRVVGPRLVCGADRSLDTSFPRQLKSRPPPDDRCG